VTGRLRRMVPHIGCARRARPRSRDFAFENKNLLAAAGIYYPKALFAQFSRQHFQLFRLMAQGGAAAIKTALATVVEQALAAGADTAFLSGEDLCAAGAAMPAKIADQHFEEKSFVLVVRNLRD
jgi:hypothetical protein